MAGGFFLALSYFGTDQSQVARYLGAKDLKASRIGLLFNAALKIPMQFFILLTGVLVFVFYQFNSSPVFFNGPGWDKAKESTAAAQLETLEGQHKVLEQEKINKDRIERYAMCFIMRWSFNRHKYATIFL